MPAYGALNSSFTVNGVVHDPLTGIDTGSGNVHLTGNGMWSPAPECVKFTSEPGGTTYFTETLSGSAGPGGTSYPVQTFEPLAEFNSFGEAPNPVFELGGSAGSGVTTFLTENLIGSADPGCDDI